MLLIPYQKFSRFCMHAFHKPRDVYLYRSVNIKSLVQKDLHNLSVSARCGQMEWRVDQNWNLHQVRTSVHQTLHHIHSTVAGGQVKRRLIFQVPDSGICIEIQENFHGGSRSVLGGAVKRGLSITVLQSERHGVLYFMIK